MLMYVSASSESDRGGGADFFVSYTRSDKDWAEWISWVLEEAGYRVIVQTWDFDPGAHFVAEMHRATQRSARTIAVLSNAYQESLFASAEWQAAWVNDPSGRERRLLAFRVEDCERKGLLRQLVTVDLFGFPRDVARERLLAAVRGDRRKPEIEPKFPLNDEVRTTSPEEPAFPSEFSEDRIDARRELRSTIPRIADSITVVAAALVLVIAATGPDSVPNVVWAVPAAVAAFTIRTFALARPC
jgi:TIR domain